jgi:hypothetical protein
MYFSRIFIKINILEKIGGIMNALRVSILSIIVLLSGLIFATWQWKANGHDVVGKPQIEENPKAEAKPPQKKADAETPKVELPKTEEVKPPKKEPPKQIKEVVPHSYKEALALSKQTNKPLFIYFNWDKCDFCVQMRRDTLENVEVQKLLSNYVVYFIDVTGPEAYVAKESQIKVVPYYLICDSNRQILKYGAGYKGVETFKDWLK